MDPTYALTDAGHRLYVDPRDPRATSLVEARGDLNPGSLVLWSVALGLRPWDVVLDVGVNYGEMLVGPDLPSGARVIGFEPNTTLHPYLARTLAERGVDVDLRGEAICDRVGTARFAVDPDWSGTSSLVDGRHDETGRWRFGEVAVTTLDEVVGGIGDGAVPSFCAKVDVEGFERQVVDGARRVTCDADSWALMLEVLHLPRTYVAALAETFAVFFLDRRTRRLVRLPGGNARLVADVLDGGWLYPQDCLVTSADLAADLEGAR